MWQLLKKVRDRWFRFAAVDSQEKPPEKSQIALPERADLPLRERSRQLVAVPARLDGGWMGSGRQ